MTVLQFLCLWEILWFDNILQFWCLWEILWFDNISNLSCNLIPLKQSCVLLFSSRKLLVQSGDPGGGVCCKMRRKRRFFLFEDWRMSFGFQDHKNNIRYNITIGILGKAHSKPWIVGCTTIFLGMLNIDNGSNNKIKL